MEGEYLSLDTAKKLHKENLKKNRYIYKEGDDIEFF